VIREFQRGDLPIAIALAERLRALDASVEPFAERLAALFDSPRARRELWRIAPAGVSFAVERAPGELQIYGAVEPAWRRRSIGSALFEPILASGRALCATVREPCAHGAAFLAHHGFAPAGRTLLLARAGPPPIVARARIRALEPALAEDCELVARLSAEAAPDGIRLSSNEYAGADLLLVAELDGAPAAYLSGALRGGALVIEDIGTLGGARRRGLARALFAAALERSGARQCQLAVEEANAPARALYRSLGFTESGARAIYSRGS
jgi:ribosomal protein S18 acetylase RimI-like enzyme